jgi:alpha-tubulin suppressor-like RCC1 family protein
MWGRLNSASDSSAFQVPTTYPEPALESPIVEVASPSPGSAIARLANGKLWAWGYNEEGELGDGTTSSRESPVEIQGLESIVSISSGFAFYEYSSYPYSGFTLALKSDGTVYSWGSNYGGYLGDGSTNSRTIPGPVTGLNSVVQVSAAMGHGMALKNDGTVWTWGGNESGELGDGTFENRRIPAQVPGIDHIVQIAACPGVSYALRSDGTLFGWGRQGLYFSSASLLPSTQFCLPSPVIIYASIQKPIIKFVCRAQSVVALLSDHSLVSWGSDSWEGETIDPLGREPGYPTDIFSMMIPAPVFGATNVRDVAASRNSGSVLFQKFDGSVWCWGKDDLTMGLGESWSANFVGVVGFGGTVTTLSTLGTENLGDSWFLQNFSNSEILNASISGDTADASGDGIPNLIKYALGLNPKLRYDSSSLPTARIDVIGGSAQSASTRGGIGLFSVPTAELTNGKHYMLLTVPRNGIHTDVDYIVEVSNDLVTWSSGDPHTVTVLDTAETLEVYSAQSLDDVPKQFMRLKVERK